MSRVVISVALYWLASAVPISAEVVLTLQETIARAHEQAGAVVIARASSRPRQALLMPPRAFATTR
jgi:hypothetical protein